MRSGRHGFCLCRVLQTGAPGRFGLCPIARFAHQKKPRIRPSGRTRLVQTNKIGIGRAGAFPIAGLRQHAPHRRAWVSFFCGGIARRSDRPPARFRHGGRLRAVSLLWPQSGPGNGQRHQPLLQRRFRATEPDALLRIQFPAQYDPPHPAFLAAIRRLPRSHEFQISSAGAQGFQKKWTASPAGN